MWLMKQLKLSVLLGFCSLSWLVVASVAQAADSPANATAPSANGNPTAAATPSSSSNTGVFASSAPANSDMPPVMVGYVSPQNLPAGEADINPIRLQALRDTATGLGATGALAWRSQQINASLQNNARQLDQIFDFNRLIINNNVVPPVLTESDNSYHQADGDAVRLSSKTYQIVKQAHFVTTPPTWRDYLWSYYSKPEMPNSTLLPRTTGEANAWNTFLQQGWQQGLLQANSIFDANLSRLKRDYKGMILYRKLLSEKMVSAPFVAKADLGVTGDANQININDQVLRITAHSQLQTDSSQWQPVLTKP